MEVNESVRMFIYSPTPSKGHLPMSWNFKGRFPWGYRGILLKKSGFGQPFAGKPKKPIRHRAYTRETIEFGSPPFISPYVVFGQRGVIIHTDRGLRRYITYTSDMKLFAL